MPIVVGGAGVSAVSIGPKSPLALICGPCVIESADHALDHARRIAEIASKEGILFIFKSSYDKANRTAGSSFRGSGIELGLEVLSRVRKEVGCPVVTDVHSPEEAAAAGKVVDMVQIPAFLCRQTDLLHAAGATKKAVLIKKGQFLAPEDMRHARQKVIEGGSNDVLLCERGACFGYRDLVVDFRSLEIMRKIGAPIVFDATHSVQVMGGRDGSSGGNREFIFPLARAATAVGVDAIFIEAHASPDRAPSDGPNMVPLTELPLILRDLKRLSELKLETRV